MVRALQSAKREQFLAAALKLFVTQGVQNTSTAEIAREAGTAAGTLFLYFPTKQDLIDQLALQFARQQAENLRARLSTEMNARETFWTIWSSTIGWFTAHMDAYLYIQLVRDTGFLSPAVAQESNQYFGFYYEVVQKGLAEGSIRPYPVELIGGLLYQDVVAVMNMIRYQPDTTLHDTYIQQGFEIFWNGIRSDDR